MLVTILILISLYEFINVKIILISFHKVVLFKK